MGFLEKGDLQKCKGNFMLKSGRRSNIFQLGWEKFFSGCPRVVSTWPLSYQETIEQGESVVSHKGTGWIWEITKRLLIMLEEFIEYIVPQSHIEKPKDASMLQHYSADELYS